MRWHMLDEVNAILARVLPLTCGGLQLSHEMLREAEGSIVCTMICEMSDDTECGPLEQDLVLLAPGAGARELAALAGWAAALPELVARAPQVRLGRGAPIDPPDLLPEGLFDAVDLPDPEAYTAWLLGPDSPFIWARTPAEAPVYRPLPADTDSLDDVLFHVRSEAEALGHGNRHWLTDVWPDPLRAVYYADLAGAAIADEGLEGFVTLRDFGDIVGMYGALIDLGAHRLHELARAAFATVLVDDAAALFDDPESDPDFLMKVADGCDPAAWSEIDDGEHGARALVERELRPALRRFVAGHHALLTAPAYVVAAADA